MVKELLTPNYIFEAGQGVCNKMGGIYTVLSTRANTLWTNLHDRVFFVGPDLWRRKGNPLFIESQNLCAAWKKYAIEKDNLSVRVSRWDIPGEPIVILVDFRSFFAQENEIYMETWEHYQVDFLHACGDCDKASMFAYATGKVVESFYRYNLTETDKMMFQAHEWTIGITTLYLQIVVPKIATISITHAASVGHSIAGNSKPLYDYLFTYNGDQVTQEPNMESKRSVKKQTAHYVSCFTTVSEIINNECEESFDKSADVIPMNGLRGDFVPKGATFAGKRKRARVVMLRVTNNLLGQEFDGDTPVVGTSGRYEFKNKGIDVFLESLNRLSRDKNLKKKVLASISVPGWVGDPHGDLQRHLKEKDEYYTTPLEVPFITHRLHNIMHDRVLDMLKHPGVNNRLEDKVKVIFAPCYQDGRDGILNKHYYDLILGEDLNICPSYYEPWGYTPLESVAFHVPTTTTDLAGFGLQANSLKNQYGIDDGAEVLHRSDYNYSEMADGIKDMMAVLFTKTDAEVKRIHRHAAQVAKQALWKRFIQYYYEAYGVALRNAMRRQLG